LWDDCSVIVITTSEKTSHVNFFLRLFSNFFNLSGGSTTSSGTSTGGSGAGCGERGETSGDEFVELFAFEGSAEFGNLTFVSGGTGLSEELGDISSGRGIISSENEEGVGSNVSHFRFL
jgi:hypothetical protein